MVFLYRSAILALRMQDTCTRSRQPYGDSFGHIPGRTVAPREERCAQIQINSDLRRQKFTFKWPNLPGGWNSILYIYIYMWCMMYFFPGWNESCTMRLKTGSLVAVEAFDRGSSAHWISSRVRFHAPNQPDWNALDNVAPWSAMVLRK